MTTTDPANTTSGAAVAAPVDRPVRPDVARAMDAVWDLVRSGPNYDGRHRNVEAAIAAAIDRAVAAERERCAQICEETWVEPGDLQVCTCKEAADKIRVA